MAGQMHSERLLPLIDAVLAEAGCTLADLDAIAFGAGPGAFTGVRIACGVAQGVGLGADRPLIAVSTLEALAHAAWRIHGATRVFACLDARMREVYVAGYERSADRWETRLAAAVLAPGAIALPDAGPWFGAGDGFLAYPELASALHLPASDATLVPDARDIVCVA